VLADLNKNNQVIYRYCNESGETTEDSNPNGTTDNIAGICNAGRNVFGMMPHPERACSNDLHNTDGKEVFKTLFGLS
jgi:phosphoribosylformylglycinamidine (FGAM) synthase-like amidotransferase family enzyme